MVLNAAGAVRVNGMTMKKSFAEIRGWAPAQAVVVILVASNARADLLEIQWDDTGRFSRELPLAVVAHARASGRSALSARVAVDLANHQLRVESSVNRATVAAALTDAGYPAN